MKRFQLIGILFTIMMLSMPSIGMAGIPKIINYQGLLLNAAGNPLDTTVSMIFSFYADSIGGSPIWADTVAAVKVTNGLCNTEVDVADGKNILIGGTGAFVGIKVGNDPEIAPRTELTSAPYAFVAEGVSGHMQTSPGKLVIGDTLQSHVSVTVDQDQVDGGKFIMTAISGDTTISIVGENGAIRTTGKVSASAYTSNSPLIFEAPAGTERARIDDITGNLGINTTNPGARVEIYGDTDPSTPLLKLKHLPDSPTGLLDDVFEIYDFLFGFKALTINGGGVITQYSGSGTIANMFNPAGASYFNAASAKLGIGTASPSAALHINGTTLFSGVATLASGQYLRSEAAGGARMLGEQGNTAARPAIGFFSTNGVDDGGGGNGIFRPAANAMAFAVQSTEKMRLTAYGLGIGTTAPTGSLDVTGINGYNQVRMRTAYTPSGTADANGNVGDLAWDDNFIYIKTSVGWKRTPLTVF